MSFSDYYETRKVSGLGKRLNTRFARLVVEEVKRHSKSGDQIIEIGPGEGRVADLLKDYSQYCAYEASPALASHLERRGLTIRRTVTPPLQENDATQQVVIATHVVEHMPDFPTAQRLFVEVARVLVPGGVFLVVSPDYNDMGKLFFDVDYSHNFVTTANRLSQMAKDAGLAVIERKYLYGSLEVLPGIILNLAAKCVFALLRFTKDNFVFEDKGIFKLEHLFSRAVFMVLQKRP
jgi:SAM-dependent methyltransferase